MKKLIIIALFIIALSSVSFAGDAPHGNDVICLICHSTVGTTGGVVPSPFWGESYTPPNVEETLLNQFCLGCHDQATGGSLAPTSAIQVRTHSSYSTGTKYGTWSVECVACHNPHYQRQFMFYRNLPSIKLAEGTVQTIDYLGLVSGIPRSRITYTGLTGKSGWTDPAKWYNKSSADRGAIIYPNGANGTYSFNILSATGDEIIVRGDVTAGVNSGLIGPGKKFMITYGMLIKEKIYAPGKTDSGTFKSPTVGTVGPATGSPVRFLDSTGTNSFAVNDLNGAADISRDGICQVCHTQTTHWRYDGSEADHNSGDRCTTCHPHSYGFKPMCDVCHGYPPSSAQTLVFKDKDGNSVTSSSSSAGAHTVHVAKFIVCQTCHTGGMTTQSDGDYLINIGFNLSGTNLGGYYDGNPAKAVYPTAAGGTTTVTDGNSLTCSSLYCHSSGQSANGESATPEYAATSPVWTGTVVCGNCHSTSGRSTGSHTKHIASGADCGECHVGATLAAYSATTHVNRSIDVGLGTYTAGGAPGNGYGNCSTAACHVSAYGPDYVQTPTWGASVDACSACHAGTPSTGSHTLHLTFSGINGACGFCHEGAVKETSGGAGHRDGNIDVINNYPANVPKHEAGSGYSNCSMINCHGTLSPTWGNNTSTPTCEKCHGSAATAIATGTFKDTGGLTTGPKAGAHASHLRNAHGLRSSPVTCNQCHDDHLDGGLTDANHMNGSRDFVWGNLATKDGAITPVYTSGSGECSNVYCHGNSVGLGLPGGTGRTPVWSDTSYLSGTTAEKCGKCHGYPPGETHPASNDCNHCHLHVNADNNGFDDSSKHINMTVDYTDICINCHDDLSATHEKHTSATTFLTGKTLGAGDYGNTDWWYSVTYISGSPKFACGYCHPNTVATHINGTRNLDLDASDDPEEASGTVKAKNATPESYTQTQGTSVTCSSVYCHSNGHSPYVYRTTPNWHGGSFANPDKCANCHGNSPYDGSSAHSAHVVGIHYQDVYTGDSGKLTPGGDAHGNPATSTTINCNVCHRNTVTMSRNKLNTVCNTCHSGDEAGYVMTIDTGSLSHVNGTPDIAFGSFSVKSKAQVRDSLASVEELNTSWNRTNGYKEANSYDASRTSPSYNSGSCSSVACHNGNEVKWTDGSISCRVCHTNLPR